MLAGAEGGTDVRLGGGPLALGWLGPPQACPIIAAARSSVTDGRRPFVADRRRLSALADRDRVMCAEA